jgi:crossover junction endodeoxyribonuclease RuvC
MRRARSRWSKTSPSSTGIGDAEALPDPALSGAMAVINEQGIVYIDDLPIYMLASGKKVKTELDLATLRRMVVDGQIDHVIIEKVAARPGQGVVSMFGFGYTSGSIYGLICGLQIPCSFVRPQDWQRTTGCGPSPDAARKRVSELYPTASGFLMRKRDSGRADAILIARHGLISLHQREDAS